jgi:hypothetical protein
MLWPGLLLLSCDKAGPPNSHQGDDSSAPPVRRSGHAPRENPPTPRDELHKKLRTAASASSPEAREEIIAEVAWNALEIDPELAREAFLQLSANYPQKVLLIQHFAMRLSEQNPDEALAWADTLANERDIAAAKGQIALVLAETDPPRAANLISESGIVGREFDVAVVQVLQRWVAKSAPDAAAWAGAFPPGSARTAGISIIVSQWAKADAKSAIAWMDSLEDKSVRMEAVLAMQETILQQPLEVRDAWLQYAGPEFLAELAHQREQAMKNVGNNVPSAAFPNGNSGLHPDPAADE